MMPFPHTMKGRLSQPKPAGATDTPAHHNGLGTTPAFGTVCLFHAAQLQGLSVVYVRTKIK